MDLLRNSGARWADGSGRALFLRSMLRSLKSAPPSGQYRMDHRSYLGVGEHNRQCYLPGLLCS